MPERISPQAKRFKIFREHLNLTQAELGAKIGRKQGTIARYEQGSRLIFPDDIKKLRDLFGLSYTWFYEGTGKKVVIPEKSNLINDLSTLKTENDQLVMRVRNLELTVEKLVKEVYAQKHGV